ncbi:beta-propeller domain-containing protein [Paenibacillus sp. MBLB4367]|uniref:beta-propeller domain-containing protein n=1 Tax=Paenibacillus sp. MBLB4367 TaxID=3384767 RepID=UPI0039083375
MNKKIIVGAMIAVLSFGTASPSVPAAAGSSADYADHYRVVLNGSELRLGTPATLVGNTTMVPLRGIAEALGAKVEWLDGSRTAVAAKDGVKIEMSIGNKTGYRNGEPVAFDTAPLLIDDTTMVPLRFFGESFGTVVKWDGLSKTIAIDGEDRILPAVGTPEKLLELLTAGAGNRIRSDSGKDSMVAVTSTTEAKTMAPAAPNAIPSPAGASAEKTKADYSATNVQVEGVDEADIVKSDGDYLYQVNRQRIVIAKANPAGEMKVASIVAFEGKDFRPNELYVDGDTLVVIGSASYGGYESVQKQPDGTSGIAILPPRVTYATKAVIFDISSKEDVRKVREVELEGSYIASRKIGSSLYLLANRHAAYTTLAGGAAQLQTPAFRDSAVSADFVPIGADKIRYMPESAYSSYMVIAGVRLDKPESAANVTAYLGAGDNVYASLTSLYVTQSKVTMMPDPVLRPSENNSIQTDAGSAAARFSEGSSGTVTVAPSESSVLVMPPAKIKMPAVQSDQTSVVYKFLLDQGQVRIVSKGEVPGYALNQFSMDEYGGYFRIATTKGDMWRTDEQTSKNNVYVLDESMNVVGKLEGVAPGERIYSVRFMGGRAYMVTFKNVDPLFVIDLHNPQSPAVLGALKIPGYSDYLHPYDETHLIGFGKDTVELSSPSGTGSSAYYQGMKIAMFDVSDVSRPIELFKEIIGDRGTDSELLRNHKALLFSKEKNLLAFPISVMKAAKQQAEGKGIPAYGQFAFQGAYIYNVDLANGFRLKGEITHLSEDDRLKAGSAWYGSSRNIERIVTIGDQLYTLSQSEIRANAIGNMKETGRLAIP